MTVEKKIVFFKSVLVTIALTFFTCSLDKHYVYANSFESKNSNQLAILFKNLSNVESYREANVVIKEIWNFWINDTANEKNRQMLKIGINLMNNNNLLEAEGIFSKLIQNDPNYMEAWNKRATVRYVMGNYDGSFADVSMVLAKEPKHFGALSGLGLILMQNNDYEGALSAYRKVLAINPFSKDALKLIPILQRKVYGSSL